jgi:membrane protein DedA with SNARE-associated domain
LRRYPDIWVLGFRFVYGLRTVMPVAIGISGYPPLRFLLLNAVSAAIWAIALGSAAFHLGSALELLLEDIQHYEILVISGLIIVGGALYGWRRYRNRRPS